MFDKNTLVMVSPRTVRETVKQDVTIHEHKAPTDESIRLYKEILDKAKEDFLVNRTITLPGGSKFDIAFFRNAITRGIEAHSILVFGGKTYKVKLEEEIRLDSPDDVIARLLNQVIKEIVEKIVTDIVIDSPKLTSALNQIMGS